MKRSAMLLWFKNQFHLIVGWQFICFSWIGCCRSLGCYGCYGWALYFDSFIYVFNEILPFVMCKISLPWVANDT